MDDDTIMSSSAAITPDILSAASLHPQPTHLPDLLLDLSLLRNKIQQVQFYIEAFVCGDVGISHAGALIEDMVSAASSILFNLQQPDLCTHSLAAQPHDHNFHQKQLPGELDGRGVVELDAGELLAKYTHSCHVCGKGFQRDANLRMHMRAHGDKYKTRAALSKREDSGSGIGRKYSCPQEGCKWNAKHERFQPLKSVACAKNHYKRSHCPKLYVCSRCSVKEFSVLSDLRTHEKHCGNPRWRCSCGTTFSRKDKLMGHVKLFAYHSPAPAPGVEYMKGVVVT